jgi:hypothetical protein
MRNDDLNPLLDLPGIPGLAFRGVDVGAQDSSSDTLTCENSLQPSRHIVLLGVNGKHLAPSAFGQFLLDRVDQTSFLRIKAVFGEILGFSDNEPDLAAEFGIKFRSVQRAQTAIRMLFRLAGRGPGSCGQSSEFRSWPEILGQKGQDRRPVGRGSPQVAGFD